MMLQSSPYVDIVDTFDEFAFVDNAGCINHHRWELEIRTFQGLDMNGIHAQFEDSSKARIKMRVADLMFDVYLPREYPMAPPMMTCTSHPDVNAYLQDIVGNRTWSPAHQMAHVALLIMVDIVNNM